MKQIIYNLIMDFIWMTIFIGFIMFYVIPQVEKCICATGYIRVNVTNGTDIYYFPRIENMSEKPIKSMLSK